MKSHVSVLIIILTVIKYFQDKKHNVNEKGNRMSDKNDGFYLSDANFNILKK
jgi:hypothetical protein